MLLLKYLVFQPFCSVNMSFQLAITWSTTVLSTIGIYRHIILKRLVTSWKEVLVG